MEYVDIFDENNNPTGETKEKNKAHEDGNFHRTAHVWIINDKNELLLQKRSSMKKTHPNCWDISGAGHIRSGEQVLSGAVRELKEELGVTIEEKELNFIDVIKSTKNPKNMEFAYVFLIKQNKDINEYVFEDLKVSEVKYVHFEKLEQMVKDKAEGLLIHNEEYRKLFAYIRSIINNEGLFKYKDIVNHKPIHIATVTQNNKPNLAVASDNIIINDSFMITSVNEMTNTQENIKYNSNVVITAFDNEWKGVRIFGKAEYKIDGIFYELCDKTFFGNGEVSPFGATKPKGVLAISVDKIEDYE